MNKKAQLKYEEIIRKCSRTIKEVYGKLRNPFIKVVFIIFLIVISIILFIIIIAFFISNQIFRLY